METLLALVNESEASIDKATEKESSHGLPCSLQDAGQDAFAALLELADKDDAAGSSALQDGDQDAFAALLELADKDDAAGSSASQDVTVGRPLSAGAQSSAELQGSEGPDDPAVKHQSTEPRARSLVRDRPDSTPQRSQKRQRSFRGSQENDSNASNMAQQAARPGPAQKRQVAAFTLALARDQNESGTRTRAEKGALRKATMAPTREKYSGLRMKNPVFPSVVLQERMSMLHFLRLSRAGDRAEAGDAAGPWATIAVLTEKSRPCQSATGQAFSKWKVSDLAGVTVTLLLFGDAHQSLYRESEGSIMAICNARASSRGPGKGISLKVADPSSVYKLGASADYALCGARTKKGDTCRNAVNVSVCRFCDFHVQGEYKRLNSSRGPLITATVGAKLGAHAKALAKRQVQPEGPRYVPPMPDMQQLESAAAGFNSQGARHVASVFRADTAGGPSASSAPRSSQAGKHKEAVKAEPKTYQNTAAQHKAKGLFAASGSATERQPDQSRPTPPARQGSARPQPAVKPLVGKAHWSTSGQPVSTANRGISSHPSGARSGQQGVKQATATRQNDGSHPPEARREAVVMLEDAEIDWDVADIQKVQQRARNMTGHDRDEEDARGMPAAPRPISPVRMPAPVTIHASGPPPRTGQARRAEGVLRALQVVRSKAEYDVRMTRTKREGGVEAMAAEQKAARKHASAALAAARTSAAAPASLASPSVSSGQEAHQEGPSSSAAAKPPLEPKAFFSAQPSRPSGSSSRPSSAGSRQRLSVKLEMAPQSALGRRPTAAGKPREIMCQPGQSAFAASFGEVLKDVDLQQTGTRYKAVIEDEEHERLDALLGTLQRKDEMQQRMEAITHLTVTAWRCTTCNSTTDKRRPSCQGHEGKSVTVTKRWWTCAGCNHRFSTLGVKYPTKRCPNARCCAPESEFIKAGIASSKARSKDVPGERALASREDFKARGTEHSFSLK